jgi:hypothetical protein
MFLVIGASEIVRNVCAAAQTISVDRLTVYLLTP